MRVCVRGEIGGGDTACHPEHAIPTVEDGIVRIMFGDAFLWRVFETVKLTRIHNEINVV